MIPDLTIPLRENVALAPMTSWKVGGPARYLAEPTEDEAPGLIRWAGERGIPVYFLGRGSNVLVADEGLPGLVLLTRNSMCRLEHDKNHIIAGAGVSLPKLSSFAASIGYSGFEFLAGIPGTVGGATVLNAGLTVFRPREMRSIIQSFDLINLKGEVSLHSMDDVHVGYRQTDLLRGDRMVIRARFKLEEAGDPAKIHQNTLEHLQERKSKQPLNKPTAGSTFRSPPGTKGAGWYIEQSGLKGFQIGGAIVSHKHANWIENTGNATSSDIRDLIAHIEVEVERKTGIRLDPEVRFLS